VELGKGLTYQKGLEKAEAGNTPNPIMTVLMGLLLFAFIFLAGIFALLFLGLGWRSITGSDSDWISISLFSLLMLLPITILLCITGVIRKFVTEEVYWSTDTEGIIARSVIRSRKVLWSDITEINLIKPKLFIRGSRILLKTRERKVFISAQPLKPPVFEASLWQHLKSRGLKPNIRLSSDAKSLFTAIPDSVPEEIDCNFDYEGRSSRQSEPDVRIEMRRECITSIAYGERAEIMWFEVKCAYWYDNIILINGKSQLLRSDEIQVPVDYSEPKSVMLALAVIRKLRECDPPQMLILPARLRKAIKNSSFEGKDEPIDN